MSLTLQTSELKRVLKLLSVVDNKTDDNIVFLVFGQSGSAGLAEDTELNISVLFNDVKSKDNLAFLVNGRKLLSVLSGVGKEVTLVGDGNVLQITSAKAKFELPLLSVEKAPHALNRVTENLHTVSLSVFKQAMNFSAMVSEENENYTFCSAVQLTYKENKNYFVGTDGSRIAIVAADVSPELELSIPYRAAKIIKELKGEEVKISQDETTIYFEAENVVVAAKKLVQKFPDFFTYIPQESTMGVAVNVEVLRQSLQSVAPMVDSETNRVEITFNYGVAQIKAQSNEGKASDEIPVDLNFDDPLADVEPVTVAVNIRFLLDYLTKISGNVTILIKDKNTPLHLTSGATQYVLATLS